MQLMMRGPVHLELHRLEQTDREVQTQRHLLAATARRRLGRAPESLQRSKRYPGRWAVICWPGTALRYVGMHLQGRARLLPP